VRYDGILEIEVASGSLQLLTVGARNGTFSVAWKGRSHPVLSGPAWERLNQLKSRAEAEGWVLQMVGTRAIDHRNAPGWYDTFRIKKLVGRISQKMSSGGGIARVQEHREPAGHL
jgi:hypothetical protein